MSRSPSSGDAIIVNVDGGKSLLMETPLLPSSEAVSLRLWRPRRGKARLESGTFPVQEMALACAPPPRWPRPFVTPTRQTINRFAIVARLLGR